VNIENNHVVTMHYTLTNDEGQTIDTSAGAEPLVYIQGLGHIIPGLESEILGKTKGDKLKVAVAPKDGYGERVDEMVNTMPKSQFPEGENIEVGMQFQADTDHGPLVFTITEVEGDNVTIDGNHPLAGVNLNFDVEIVDIREATKDELEHGHVHGEGCDH